MGGGGGCYNLSAMFLKQAKITTRRITMKRLLVSSIAAMALTSSVVVAEESGVFVGLGLGFGGSSVKAEASIDGVSTKDTANGSGLNYGLVAGYKQFFTDGFGLRYYANIDYNSSKIKVDTEKVALNVINYGVNVDALYNFVSSDGMDFGAFLGLGLGANTWSGKAVDGFKDQIKDSGKKVSTTGFDLALNAGLRGVFAKQHGVEIFARVPFIATTMFDVKDDTWSVKASASRNYNAGVRYTFSF
ncbi:outer membrane insertion signal domain protein [Helicobacter cinaedi CCUG 18818 = ATCC BAA-847]|uniref:Outer membrane insertion signal domain protein n=4 Tax=Helicobacter cinaedi TaxID=213 RepID=A0ABN0BDZ6_9HELI|nr:outer membrane insertion signal domain protein [Helicobacter cinaedi CCUG 18818 = ATCC BAA-847]